MGREYRRQPFRTALGVLLSLFSVSVDSSAIGVVFAQQPLVLGHDRTSRSEDLAAGAKSFVSALTSKWSDTNAAALGGLDALYAAKVDYFGKRLSRDRVLADKRRFVERWPERTYKIQSSHEQCSALECLVEGYVEWETRSPARKASASGVAKFRYVLMFSGRAFVIGEEDGINQRRSQIPYQSGPAIAKSARHYSIYGEDVTRDQELQPKAEIEKLAAITIDEDVQRVLAVSHQRGNPPSQPESTIARETYPDRNARSGVFDARFITATVIILSFILWRAVRWEFRKSKSKINAEARTSRRTERREERKKHNNGKRSHTLRCRSARGRWDQHGPTGPRVTSKAQGRGAEEQEGLELGWQELREAVKEAEAEHQWQRKRSTHWQSDGTAWWRVLEVSPAAGKDEIVRSYRRKIQRCHPDRVCGLASEFVLLAEKRTKTLNDAYAQAMHARK